MHVTIPAPDEGATKSWAKALREIRPELAANDRSKGRALEGTYLERGGIYDLPADVMIVGYDKTSDHSATIRLWQVNESADGDPLTAVKVWTSKTGRIGQQILLGIGSRFRDARPPAPPALAKATVQPGPPQANQHDDTCWRCYQPVPARKGVLARDGSGRARVQHADACPPRPPRINQFWSRCVSCGGDVEPGLGHLTGSNGNYEVRHAGECPPPSPAPATAPRRRNTRPDNCRRCLQDVAAGDGLLQDASGEWRVVHAGPCPPYPLNPDGAPTWTVTTSDIHGGYAEGAPEGTVKRLELWGGESPEQAPGLTHLDGRRVSFIAMALACRHKRAYDHDEEEDVTTISTVWRAATDAEAADVLAAEERARRRRALTERVERLFAVSRYGTARDGAKDGVRPDEAETAGLSDLPLVPLSTGCGSPPPYEPQVRLDETADVVWAIAHNGLDGDDWRPNNYGGYIATRHPLTDERRTLIADLRAELELEIWTNQGVAESAAQVLIAAGWGIETVKALRVFTLEAEADAQAMLDIGIARWEETGWWSRYGDGPPPRFTPADAARLADADISYTKALALHRAGFETAAAMLEAQPPAIPDDATRIIIRPKHGRSAEVTTDVDLARAWLSTYRDHWDPDLLQTDTGPQPVHVGPSWSLWDDGSLVVCSQWMQLYQIDGGARQAPRPTGLSSAAAEAIALVADAANRDCADREVWHPLREATALTRTRITDTEKGHSASGSSHALDRIDIATPAGAASLWQVTTEWWYMGEDGDAGMHYSLHNHEKAARASYKKAAGT